MKTESGTPIENQPSALAGFTDIYAAGNPPWDIDKPQPPFIAIADQVMSPLLDSGCGKGTTSLFFAAKGYQVTGIDFVELAIQQARARATERNLSVSFLVKDAMTLTEWDAQFASVIDSGLFHIYPAGKERQQYVQGLKHVLVPGGRLFLFSFRDHPSAPGGGVSNQELREAFADGWEVESVELSDGEMNPVFAAEFPNAFPKDEPIMWFAIIRRTE
jgi:SAM-dependent methyltransferase